MRSHLRFTKQEKRGIFFLLLLIAGLQFAYYLYTGQTVRSTTSNFAVDSILTIYIDSVKTSQLLKEVQPLKAFNPNFITDYKGYVLGLAPSELDRIYAFRKQGQFINSAKEFQKVSQVSDSLLAAIGPYFKFPSWTKVTDIEKETDFVNAEYADINTASEASLQRISGIGKVLSKRIIAFRNSLGGFIDIEQLFDVYGLKPEVARRAMKVFKVVSVPDIKKIPLNSATANELASLVYINKRLARQIVHYRDSIGQFDSIAELTKIEDFPTDRIHRIKLYLSLEKLLL
ncbi:ComEA family DNA-binding protein [Muriicola sp.]|uniref:ComEA family DNA-binding protein n=1 Tax=Muriicola sp. TaxID=2020856 RepID=UPI003C732B41